MRIGRSEGRKTAAGHHGEAAILFAVGGHRFAIAATDVDEIRDVEGMLPLASADIARASEMVRYTLQRERRTYAVVDAGMHFHLLPSKPTRLLVLRNGTVALTADSIDRMVELMPIVPLPKAFQGKERKWYRGLALIDEAVVPVVNPAEILSEGKAALAGARLQRKGAASA